MKTFIFFRTWLMLLAMGFLFAAPMAQAQNQISDEEMAAMLEAKQAQWHTAPAHQALTPEQIQAKADGKTFTLPANGSRAALPIKIELTVDSYPSEASYNLWSVADAAWYWLNDQVFFDPNVTVTHLLALEEGNEYEMWCYDTYGDGGIAGVVSNDDTGWPITDWASTDYDGDPGFEGVFPFTSGPGEEPLPPTPDDITAFPYFEDFETGAFPTTMVTTVGDQANLDVSSTAANASTYGAYFQGNIYTGWLNVTNGDDAFDINPTHVAVLHMNVVPSGDAGLLSMKFDFRQSYTYGNQNYEWFRVRVNGMIIPDVNGVTYQQADDGMTDPFGLVEYDLSAYQNDASFALTLENSGKYWDGYTLSYDGDVAMVDNFELYYLNTGAVEGQVFNGDGIPVRDVVVGVEGYKTSTTDNNGYYLVENLPTGPHTLLAWRNDYNPGIAQINIIAFDTIQQDFTLTRPLITVEPLIFDERLNPNGFLKTYLNLLNTGDGVWNWGATIVYPETVRGASVSFNPATLPGNWNGVVTPTTAIKAVNSNGGAAPSQGTRDDILQYDDGVNFEAIGLTAGGTMEVAAYWPAATMGAYAGMSVKEVEVYINDLGADLKLKIYDQGTSSEPGDLLYEQPFVPPAVGWFTVTLASSVDISGDDMWVGYEVIHPAGVYAPGCDAGPAVAGYGDMIYSSSAALPWQPMSALGLNYNWNIHTFVGAGGAGNWLTLDEYTGYVQPGGGTVNIGTNFNAAGTTAGEVYNADIVITSSPDVGTITVPVTMVIAGEELPIIDGFTAELTNEATGEVTLMWNAFREVTLEYYAIWRNGAVVATTTNSNSYVDMLPAFGTYDYHVQPIFVEGDGIPVGPETVYWYEPEACFDDDLENTQFTGEVQQVPLWIENCGDGVLLFEFPDFVGGGAGSTCDYTLKLYDTFGDGWNGSTIDLYLDGEVVVSAAAGVGSGPTNFDFEASMNQEITTFYNMGTNPWPYENWYEIVDCDGNVVWTAGTGSSGPANVEPGQLFTLVPFFVVAVEPATGMLEEGEEMYVQVSYSSVGFPVDVYHQDIVMTTNEPDAPASRAQDYIVSNTMYVIQPEMIYGTVTDTITGLPLQYASVTAAIDNGPREIPTFYETETDANGEYMLYVAPDKDYNMTAWILGYQLKTATVSYHELPAMVDFALREAANPVGMVLLDPNEDDDEALVTWSLPMSPYMISYDDGTAEDFFAWSMAGGMSAVKFTPAGYPAVVTGGSIYVGDGSFPGGPFLGSQMVVGVMDDDGPDGMPGTILDSVPVTVNNYGWLIFNGEFYSTFDEGDFYLVTWQLGDMPDVAPVGVDTDSPIDFRSYVKQYPDSAWMSSLYNDFMIRAFVSGPASAPASVPEKMIYPGKLSADSYVAMGSPSAIPGLEGTGTFAPVIVEESERSLNTYQLYRFSNMPLDGDGYPIIGQGIKTLVNPALTGQMYNDGKWRFLDADFYAYGVIANYTNDTSGITYSNIAAHDLDNEITFNVTQCDGLSPEGVLIVFSGNNYPFKTHLAATPESGTVVFDSVIDGSYDLSITKDGYIPYTVRDMQITEDEVFDITLSEMLYPARNLSVELISSVATWNSPFVEYLENEGFDEGTDFPPDGWAIETEGIGWEHGANGSSAFWAIPPGDGWYTYANDDQDAGNNGCCDYLIIPEVDLSGSDAYLIKFDAYLDGAYGHQATVEYSLDGGANWDVGFNVPTNTAWTTYMVEIPELAGNASVLVAFHSNDGGGWTSGFAVDNVSAFYGQEPISYHVMIDGGFVTAVPGDVTSYKYEGLTYGVTYIAEVRAAYSCGVSTPIYYSFESGFLYAPRNLTNEYIYGTNEIPLFWNPPVTVEGPGSFDPSTYTPGTSPAFALDVDPDGQPREVTFDREVWDILYGFEMDGPSGLVGLAGAESDGEFVYAPVWSGNQFVKYMADGTFVETFTIDGVSGVRDMAFDGMYMYGAAASTTVWQMDFTGQTMEGTINAPTACRALAYDEETDTFWGNNWETPFTNFDRDGNSIGNPITVPSIYGAAFDNYSDDGPFIWVFSGTGATPGCQVEQMDLTGTMTGEGHSVSGDFGADGIAGGLYMDGNIVPGLMTLGGTMQGAGDVAFGYEMGPYSGGGGPGAGEIPDGLASFNVYRDGAHIGSAPYNDEGSDEFIEFIENHVPPGCYEYSVTAVYDLTDYGFPGMTGESMHEGPSEVCIVWGLDLPFMETWDNPSLAYQDWTVDGENWGITSNVGSPEPSAEFTWDPDPGEDYSVSLTSSPLNADLMTEGDIWLDFEVALDNRNATGDEKLTVEVYDGNNWSEVFEFNNETAGADFSFQHLQITDFAKNRVFQIRFNANGMNSFDIISWFVDNISVYRTCEAPQDLDGEYVWNLEDDFGAEITWEAPEMPANPEIWLYYHDGTIEYVWGSDTGDWESDVAMWFDQADLADFPECAVTEVALFSDSRGANGGYVIAKVYEGPDAETLLYEEDISSQMLWNDDMTYVTLAQPVPFDNTKDLWIVFTTGGPIDVYIAGLTMELPAPARKGDLYRDAGEAWSHASDLGIGERAWILEAYVTQDYAPTATPVPLIENREFVGHGSTTLAPQGVAVTADAANSSREFSGFNIYRMGPDDDEYSYLGEVAYETGVTDYSYYDEDPFSGAGYPYEVCYQVTGKWASDTDECESPPAKAVIPIYDYVCIMVTSIGNPLTDGMTALYPNPATDRVNIASSQSIDRITIVNYVGQVIYDAEVSDENSVVLNTSDYGAGMYIVRISTANGVVTKRMIISN